MTQNNNNNSVNSNGLFADKAFTKSDLHTQNETNEINQTSETEPQTLIEQNTQNTEHSMHTQVTDEPLQEKEPNQSMLDNHDSNAEPQEDNQFANRFNQPIIMNRPIKLAIIGHTNTGKTSILRTLLRDKYFGEVKDSAATTRHVEKALISNPITNQDLVALYDTPGLEDASGVMDWLEDNTSSRQDGIERLQQFLQVVLTKKDSNEANDTLDDFSQEAKVINQLLDSDVAIYVIDAREPVLSKYKDELTILSWSATPVMPVFNFSASSDNKIEEWLSMLARRNLHVSSTFDSVAFEFDDEMALWQNLTTMMHASEQLDALIKLRKENWLNIFDDANIILADFLINVASFVEEINEDDDPLPTLNTMQEAVKQAERKMHQDLLNLYKFYDNSVVTTPLQLNEYQQDPFDSEVLKSYGIKTTSGAAAGALIGLGIDAATFGVSLGLGAALGGLAGGLLSNTNKLADMITGVKSLYIDPTTITLLATRNMELHQALRHRGHATNDSVAFHKNTDNPMEKPWKNNKLPSILKQARTKPHWSSLSGGDAVTTENLRKDAAWTLSTQFDYPDE